jgi:hypothetical protein
MQSELRLHKFLIGILPLLLAVFTTVILSVYLITPTRSL